MKKGMLSELACLLCAGLSAQSIDFNEGSWQSALDQAKAEGKYVFVDAYTTWCGPCKAMTANVFTDPEVGAFYNDNFVSIKLDTEKEGDGKIFAKEYEVRAYPSLVYFDPSGEIVHRGLGYHDAPQFITLGKEAMNPDKQFYAIQKSYDEHQTDPEWILNYAVAASGLQMNKSDVLDNYMNLTTEEDWKNPETFEKLTMLQVDLEHPLYGFIYQNRYDAPASVDQDKLEYFLESPKRNVIRQSLSIKEEQQLKGLNEKVSRALNEEDAEALMAQINAIWYQFNKPEEAYEKQVVYLDNYCEDWQEFNGAAWNMVENEETNTEKLAKGMEWVNRSIEMERNYFNLDTKAWLLFTMGDHAEAKSAAKEAIKVAKENGMDTAGTKELLQKIEES